MKFRQKYMEVQLVEVLGADKSEFSLSDKDFREIIGDENWNTPEFRNLMLGDTPSDIFDLECHRWIAGISNHLSQDELQTLLLQIHSQCIETLQGEYLLPRCKEAERMLLEQRFTDIIELISYYIQAIRILREGKAEHTISQILSTLSTCAYIYHPRKQFCIMQCIFMLDFSIMEKLITSILTTLRSQQVYLWNRKPFQMQWLKLLQSYVENIYHQTDRLSSDATTKETMIQVLTIELILGRHASHKIYDNSLNQALLYRLVSLMNVSDPNKTLQKAFLSLFTPTEFNAALPFNSDDAFVLANMLCSQQDNETVESFEPAKYENETTLLTVNEQAITIQPKDLDKENVYMPLSSRMGLWHGLSIRLDEKPPVKLRGKVGTTIEHYKELWEYINHSLFSQKRKSSKKQNRKLYIDDETTIIVTKQLAGQLLFECKVVEEGCEGVGTLDVLNDVVPFFPGDINTRSFEYQGMPLLLHAYVKEVNNDGSYVFAMRDMISEYADDVRVNDLFYNSRLTCLLFTQVPDVPRVPAVSSEGFSVSVCPAPGMTLDDLKKGMVIEVDNITEGTNGYLNGTFLRNHSMRNVLFCPLFSDGKELVLVGFVYLARRCTHAFIIYIAYGFRCRAWLDVDDEYRIADIRIEVSMYIMCSFLTEIIDNLIVDIYLILISGAFEERVLQVLFQSHFIANIRYAQIEMAALGIEEGTYFLHNLDGLSLHIHSHGVFRIDDGGLELGMEIFLAIVLLVGR